jgi:hypothetical protein
MKNLPPLNQVFYIEYLDNKTIEYSIIRSCEARNRDGSLAAPNIEGFVIQAVEIPKQLSKRKIYINHWSFQNMEGFLDWVKGRIKPGKGFIRKS